MNKFLESALKLAKRGFHVFPIVANRKKPSLIPNFPELATSDPIRIKQWWGAYPDANIGISTTHFGEHESLCLVDIDNKPSEGRDGFGTIMGLEIEGKDFPSTFEVRTPSGGVHLIYRCQSAVKQGVDVLGSGIDIRSKGGYGVGPGSVLEGIYYQSTDRPIAQAPLWILEACGKPRVKSINANIPIAGIDAERAIRRAQAYLENEAPVALQGERNHSAFLTACRLKDFGIALDSCVDLMITSWRCEPMLDPEELSHVVRSAYTYGSEPVGVAAPEAQFDKLVDFVSSELSQRDSVVEKEQHPFKKLNEEFAFTVAGGRSHILWETKDAEGKPNLVHLEMKAFHDKFSSWTMSTGDGKTRPTTELWMRSPERRSYDGICFMPKVEAPPRFYNLWRGFTVDTPDDINTLPPKAHKAFKMFLDLMLNCASQGDPTLCHWLTGYFVQLIQRPYEKPRVALVFKGSKGVGKDSIVETIGALLGIHYLMTSNERFLVGNFNGHMENLLLFVLNEAHWAGDKRNEGILKDLITGKTHLIEHKNQGAYTVANLSRIVIIGNEEWIVPASHDERRYAVYQFTDARKNQVEYFKELHEGMKDGGYQILLKYLSEYDISNLDLNTAPKTTGLLEQKIKSLDIFAQWWMDCLTEGRITASDFGEEWPEEIDRDRFRAAFKRYCKERQIRTRVPDDRSIGRLVKQVIPTINDMSRRRDGISQIYVYRLPDVPLCRQMFEKYLGHEILW